jgi:Tol biopolymer transport system component
MRNRSIVTGLLALLALALAVSSATAAVPSGAVVFSKKTTTPAGDEGGLFAVKDGHLNQLTEDPTDSQPTFSADGRTIAFVRGGDIFAMRADGSGQRQLTNGPELDGRPLVSPNGLNVLFERRASEGAPRDLFTVRVGGGGLHALTSSPEDDHEASYSPDGCTIAFVRSVAETSGGTTDDIYTVRPSGTRLTRLTHSAHIDEFDPRDLDETIVFSRGESSPGPSAYADIYTMRDNGTKVRSLIAGVGSAYVEDATADGRLLLFRRDQGLWVKRISAGKAGDRRARKLSELADGSTTNSVFSFDGRSVAAFVASDEAETLSSIAVANGARTTLAEGFSSEGSSSETTIGSVIAWQPVRR